MTADLGRIGDGITWTGAGCPVAQADYLSATIDLLAKGRNPRPRVFPIALKWNSAKGKYDKRPLCGAAPGWKLPDRSWLPGVSAPPAATHFGVCPADFGLLVIDEDNDRLADLIAIVEAADVFYATIPTNKGHHVAVRWDYGRWIEPSKKLAKWTDDPGQGTWTAGKAGGDTRGAIGWVTLWHPEAFAVACDLAYSPNVIPLLAALKRPKLASGRHDEANKITYHHPERRDEMVLWLLASGYDRREAIRHADMAAKDGARDGNERSGSVTMRATKSALEPKSPVSVSRHMPIVAKFEPNLKRWWLFDPETGYSEVHPSAVTRKVEDFTFQLYSNGTIDEGGRVTLDNSQEAVVKALSRRADVVCRHSGAYRLE